MRKSRYIIILTTIVTVLALMTACTKPDRSDDAQKLSKEIINEGSTNVEHSLERVDSAEQAGLFTAIRANTIKAIISFNADRRRMAAYYAEKAITAEKEYVITTSADSNLYCRARWILGNSAYADGEYGKSLALSKEILAFVGDDKTPKNIEMKCRALMQMADCENELGHVDEAERLFLQGTDILMESTQHATSFSEVDPLIYTLLSLNDLYIDNKTPEKALSQMAKIDTAMNRLIRCPDSPDWVIQMRRNHTTISKAMVYAANGQHEQAEALFREHQQFQGLDDTDKTAEGVCLTMMGRYDEAIRMFDEADSIKRKSGAPITNLYVNTLLNYKYEALQKAGRTAEALALGDRIRQLTDSIRQQERQAEVEQLQEIKQQEEEIIRKHQSLTIHRIILASAFLVCLLIAYLLGRSYKYNKVLTEKNRKLYEEIEQHRQEQQEEKELLQAAPKERLTTEQQLFRRLCMLMDEQQPYTDETLNRDTLASLLGTNVKYVEQAIRQCSKGETVGDFINRYRLEHVARLLKTTDDPIAIIGELSGIPSRATLARLFRNAYGMTPTEYRKI